MGSSKCNYLQQTPRKQIVQHQKDRTGRNKRERERENECNNLRGHLRVCMCLSMQAHAHMRVTKKRYLPGGLVDLNFTAWKRIETKACSGAQ